METVVGIEGNDEAKLGDSVVVKSSSAPSLLNYIADPIVYKLVRVEGDGRLVPATDDEVMEVEDLLKDDKGEMHFVVESEQIVGCTSNDGFSSATTQLNGSEGLVQSENPTADTEKSSALLDAAVDPGKLDARVEEIVPSSALSSNDSYIQQFGCIGECSKSQGGSIESGLSTSVVSSSLKPDFSKLKGEICLDNLSVKELHETFKATFGRETSVKDKQWLKRRIAMALTNSCDISCTTFVIKDGIVVKKCKEEIHRSVDASLPKDLGVGAMSDNCEGSPISQNNQMGNSVNDVSKRSRNPSLEYGCTGEDLDMEQRAAKRVRKPTRRYIEELSEVESRECSGKSITSVKNSRHGESSSKPCVRPVQNARTDGMPLVTRQDSLGGSGVQVPYVSRVRRCRPRENFMPLMKLQPSGVGMAARLVKKALCVRGGPRPDKERGSKVLKTGLASGWIQQSLIAETEKSNQYMERKTAELEKGDELKHADSSGTNSDNNVMTVPTAKGGMRRKHHRPWTLSEVVKLVEGVARYGAGRWSEIKRVAFASYSYRTSVDLKDKWRNLLRASFMQLPTEQAINNSRKHASAPIPAAILSRVRELAEVEAQVPPNLSSTTFAGHGGRSVHETRSGYL